MSGRGAMTIDTWRQGAPPAIWVAPAARRNRGSTGRIVGAIVGLLVPALYVRLSPDHASLGPNVFELPSLLAGAIGGWLFGRSAWSRHEETDWVQVVFGLGLAALFIGAVTIGLQVGAYFAGLQSTPGDALAAFCSVAAGIVILGMTVPGLFVLPITIALAGVWALAMIAIKTSAAELSRYVSGKGTHWPSATPTATKSG